MRITTFFEHLNMDSSVESLFSPNQNSDFFIGLSLAVCSSVFIGSSFIIKKLSLIRLNRNGNLRAGSGGLGYLKDWMWWLGLLTMGCGELFNFAAYAFAPASLVTPLGALSILVSTVLASKFLKESLYGLAKLGCLLCIIGSTIIVYHAPKGGELRNLDDLIETLQDALFLKYISVVLLVIIVVIFYLGPKYGSRFVTVYLLLCSVVGSLTVIACKGLGVAVRESFAGPTDQQAEAIWISLALIVTVVVCICIQMTYLNRALDLFSTSVVTPVYYVIFTTCVLLVSAVLFKEFKEMSFGDISGELCGFAITVAAIFLVTSCKESSYQLPLKNNFSHEYSRI